MSVILIGLFSGLLAAGLSYFFATKLHGKELGKKLSLLYFITLFFIFNAILLSVFSVDAQFGTISDQVKNKLPKKVYVQIREFSDEELNKISFAGLKRLDITDLLLWNKLRLTMAAQSKSLCSGLWTGKLTSNTILVSVEGMTANERKQWVGIGAKAVQYEIEKKNYQAVEAIRVNEAFADLAKGFNEENKLKFVTILQQGPNANEDDGCFAMMEIMKYIDNEKSVYRDDLVRGMAQAAEVK